MRPPSQSRPIPTSPNLHSPSGSCSFGPLNPLLPLLPLPLPLPLLLLVGFGMQKRRRRTMGGRRGGHHKAGGGEFSLSPVVDPIGLEAS